MSSTKTDTRSRGQESAPESGTWGPDSRGTPSPQPTVLLLLNAPAASLPLVAAIAERGLKVAGPFDSLRQAAAWMGSHIPAAVVMDIALQDGETFDLARELRRKDIRFLFFTSSANFKRVPVDLRGALFLQNPKQLDLLLRMLSTLAAKTL